MKKKLNTFALDGKGEASVDKGARISMDTGAKDQDP
jgi:hypothetical protein